MDATYLLFNHFYNTPKQTFPVHNFVLSLAIQLTNSEIQSFSLQKKNLLHTAKGKTVNKVQKSKIRIEAYFMSGMPNL